MSRGPQLDPCRGKIGYPTKAKADEAARAMSIQTDSYLESYRCPKCRHWHIGHPPGYRDLLPRAKQLKRLQERKEELASFER